MTSLLDKITSIDGGPSLTRAYEQVDHPQHYQMPGGVEVIDLVEHLPFNLGNAVKYTCRAGRKPGVEAATDIDKAIWYLRREQERLSKVTP